MAETGITRRKRSNGTTAYRVTWRDGGTRTGKSQSRTFDKLGDAKAFQAAVVANGYRAPASGDLAVAAPAARKKGGPSFADYGRDHIALRTGIGQGQRNALRRDLDRHMATFFTDLAVTPKQAQEWLRGLEDGTHPWLLSERIVAGEKVEVPRPLAPRTRRRLITQAGAILNAAMKERLIEDNPLTGIRVGREDHDRAEEQVILTHEEWALLRSCIPQDVGRGVADLLIGTGCRFGEATAVFVRHVDLDRRTVRIAQSWQPDGKGGATLGPTKSRRSRRTVDIGKKTVTALEPFLAGRKPSELLFAARNGERLRASNYWRDVWTPAVRRARAQGLAKEPRVHDLRHSHVAWLLARNVSIGVIQQRLGHEDISTTLNVYGHLLPRAGEDAADAIDDALE